MRTSRRNVALDLALIALIAYVIAFYAFDLPSWLRVGAGVVLAAAWLTLYVATPLARWLKRLG